MGAYRLRDEWPTIALILVCYFAFALMTYFASTTGLWVAIPLLAIILTLHSSLQHEILHGHPTKSQHLNDLIVIPALGLLIPYLRFKDLHLAHHYDPNLTDPYDDPESNYLDPHHWHAMPVAVRQLYNFNNTLFGRMLVGPAIGLVHFYRLDMKAILQGDRHVLTGWLLHAFGFVPVFLWQMNLSTMPWWSYFVSAYLAISILKIRTFLEHRAHERAAARTVIIEDRGFLSLLFLNNNFHSVHHTYPKLPWHRLPGIYGQRKQDFLKRNGGYLYRSYGEVFRQFLFERKDPVAHPLRDAPLGMQIESGSQSLSWEENEQQEAGGTKI